MFCFTLKVNWFPYQAVEETVVTQDIPCSQDVNWDRLSKQVFLLD